MRSAFDLYCLSKRGVSNHSSKVQSILDGFFCLVFCFVLIKDLRIYSRVHFTSVIILPLQALNSFRVELYFTFSCYFTYFVLNLVSRCSACRDNSLWITTCAQANSNESVECNVSSLWRAVDGDAALVMYSWFIKGLWVGDLMRGPNSFGEGPIRTAP